MRRWGLWLVLLVGCGPFRDLPESEQRPWFRCAHAVMASQCGPSTDAVYRGICGRQYADEYASQPREGRIPYLIGHGCPRDVAEYRSGSSGGSAPGAPVAATAAPAAPRAARIERRAASSDAPGLVRFVYEFPGRVLTLVGRTGTLDPPMIRFAADVHGPVTACTEVRALAGQVLLRFPNGEVHTELIDGGMRVAVTSRITPVDAASLANAASVSVQLCEGGPAITLPAAAIDTLGAWHREWAAQRPAQ